MLGMTAHVQVSGTELKVRIEKALTEKSLKKLITNLEKELNGEHSFLPHDVETRIREELMEAGVAVSQHGGWYRCIAAYLLLPRLEELLQVKSMGGEQNVAPIVQRLRNEALRESLGAFGVEVPAKYMRTTSNNRRPRVNASRKQKQQLNRDMTRISGDLMYLIVNEETRTILETIIEKMSKAGDSSEHVKQWREKARAYISEYPKYDENYWVAAYILYTNPEFKKLFDRLIDIDNRIVSLDVELYELKREQKMLEERIQRNQVGIARLLEIARLLGKDTDSISILSHLVEKDKNRLKEVKETRIQTLNKLGEIEKERDTLLFEMQEIAEHLVIS
jgi:hypothetical protein